jgi:hypothetical protein
MDNKRKIGEEELKRALLMMKYDSKKTLTENVNEVEKPQLITEWIWWAVGAAAVAIPALASWIDSVSGGGDSFDKTRIFFQGCPSALSKMKPTQTESEHRKAADTIWQNSAGESWYQGFGSGNEEAIASALKSMNTVADLCAMNGAFYETYSRDLFDVLDSEIDGDDFTTYVWVPIQDKIKEANSQLEQAQSEQENSSTTDTTTDSGH